MKTFLTTLFIICLVQSVFAEWNIDKPTKTVPNNLSGELFGKKFELGEAKWSSIALTLTSKNKLGNWPESELIIFLKKDDGKSEWYITPENSDFGNPHIHMKFAKESAKFPGTLMFMDEYSMFLKIVDKKKDRATFQIHMSLPDYKKSFLLGTFTAQIAD